MNRFRKENRPAETKKPEASQPMREFVDDLRADAPPRPKSRLSLILALVSLLVVVLIGAVAIWIAVPFGETDEEAVEEIVRKNFSSGTDEVNVSDLISAHVEAIGGRDVIRQIRSVRYQGRLTSTTGEYEFLGLLLSPDKGMLVTSSDEGGSVKLMLNGKTAWQVIEQQDGPRKVVPLGEQTKKSLQWSLRIHNSFRVIALEGDYRGIKLKELSFDGKPCYELTKTNKDGTKLKAILDKETLYLLKTEETFSNGEGEDEDVFSVVYGDHRIVSGVVEAHSTQLYRNGVLDNEAVVSSYRINPGLVSSLFEIPEGLTE